MTQVSSSARGGGPLPATPRGRATRRALLDAAEEVFGELSYDRASVAEITRRAGVAQGTFYVYFPDKEAAFVQLVRELNHSLRKTIAMAVDGLTDRIEIERAGFRSFYEYVTKHSALYKIVREAEFVNEEIYRWHYRTLSAGYVRGLEKAIEAGQIRSDLDPETTAQLLMGIAEFTGGEYVLGRGGSPSEETFQQILGFIERGLTCTDGGVDE